MDWGANKIEMKASPVARQHWVTKFDYGMCGTGKMIKIWKQRLINNCPVCGAPNETSTHILKCRGKITHATWD